MLLEVKGLKTYFRNNGRLTEAVDGIDFEVAHDEVVSLVGESGSGKSVTALSILRLLPGGGWTEAGEILFEGKDLLKLNESGMLNIRGKNISMIFQEPFTSLNPVVRVGEQIREVLLIHKHLSRKTAFNETLQLLKKVQIKDPERIYSSYPHQLSGGQRQRVMIAMAIALKPKLLIADEPTTALDVTIQSEILKLLLDLKRDFKMSILFITHDFAVVNEVADRVIVMKDGGIVESQDKTSIMKAPKNAYTKKLLDAIPRISTEEKLIPSEKTPFIRIENLSKRFSVERGVFRKKIGDIKAVDNANFVLKKGRTLGLVGESASGKTTLGRLLLGLIEKDSGKILIEGKTLDEHLKTTPKEIRKMMQIVFQDPYGSLDPHMRMKDIVLEGPDILGFRRKEKETLLKEILEKVNLDYKDGLKYPHQFSGGQRQRIAIARALVVKPQFLVLDEPVSSLDVLIQKDILDLLKSLQKDLGLTYLFISHDLRVVEAMSDEVTVMYQGQIVETASCHAIYTNPQHPYTKKLLSSIPALVF